MRVTEYIPLATMAMLTFAAPSFGQSATYSDDRNGDGVITRDEWRGSDRSFRDRDRNNDGVLSGDEVPASMRTGPRNSGRYSDSDSQSGVRNRSRAGDRGNDALDKLDKNNSGVVEGYEWPYNAQVFHQLVRNGDSVLSRDELNNLSSATVRQLDKNGNGRLDPDEWPGGFAQFDGLDENRDGRISANEYYNRGGEWQRRQRFDNWDRNRDGRISADEWQSNSASFRRLDRNRDGQIDRDEFMANTDRYDRPYGWRDDR